MIQTAKNDVNLSIQHTTRKTTVGIQAANREIWDTNSNMAMSPDFRLSQRLVPNIRSSVLGHGPFMCVVVDTAGLPSSLRNARAKERRCQCQPSGLAIRQLLVAVVAWFLGSK